jgi:hypothetical protein
MKSETTKVKNCTCSNKGQDELYGKGNRVFNRTSHSSEKAGESGEYRCTVCGLTIKTIN